MTATPAQLTHPFEARGLGLAPFKYVGYRELIHQAHPGAPAKPGGTCDYCGTAIRDSYDVRSADGKTFHVGSDCVGKLARTSNCKGDATLQAIHRAANARKLAAKHARDAATVTAVRVQLALPAVCAAVAAFPHPVEWRAAQGATRLDWCAWMLEHAGTKGQLEVAAFVAGVV